MNSTAMSNEGPDHMGPDHMGPDHMGNVVVIVFPAFTRSARDLAEFVSQLRERGFDAAAITLAPKVLPILYCHRRHLRSVANRIIDRFPNRPLIIMGHSGGASAATYVAGLLTEWKTDGQGISIRGVVLIDGVDSPNHLIAQSLPQLGDLNVGAVLAPPSPCNRQGALASYLTEFPWVRVVSVPGAGHGDIEGGNKSIYRRFCGDNSTDAVIEEFRDQVIAMALEFGK